jgi:hypothetical protein
MKTTLLPILALASCAVEPPEYDYGMSLSRVAFNLYSEDMGVHPSMDVLADPGNPFALSGVSVEGKWQILEAGHWPATFYAWATVLTAEATGETQFYTALSAQQIYERRDCDSQDLYYVWQIAVDGYQTVLDEFSDSVTYDATGTVAYPLAPIAFANMEALGATPQGWVMVEGQDGTVTVVPIGAPVGGDE